MPGTETRRCPALPRRPTLTAARRSLCTSSKTDSKSAVFDGKWWYRAPVVTRACSARSSTDVAAKPWRPNRRRPAADRALRV